MISGATGQDYTAISDGDYYDIITINGCSSGLSNTIHLNVTNIELDENKTINIYPNPMVNELIIETKGKEDKLNIEILNSLGQIVYKGNLIEKSIIQTSNFAPGVYLIKLYNVKYYEINNVIKE